ncbi:hypothetical protein PVMG_06123 [Plasmodium vivax Mauritania I]|uniref:Uncharacterized protein n=1 Tax=Plasmodium vivax Mauritania I TaxID=1035515 RepID=A0A0J9VQM9_PLAVI|nr:hypothetical protein PVMG_06123 [Plasmodium vivax Mauritania I]
MILLKSSSFKNKKKLFFLFNIVIFIILICIYELNNVSIYRKSFDNINSHDISNNTRFYRSLANHEIRKNVKYQRNSENWSDVKMNEKIKDCKNDKSTYDYLQNGIKGLESYKNNYRQRYSKKKGLAKIDCYLEKKVFDKIEYIYNLARKETNKKNTNRKIIFNKYTMGFILFALLPLLGFIFPTIFSGDKREDRLFPWTNRTCTAVSTGDISSECSLCKKGFYHLFTGEGTYGIYSNCNAVITLILLIASCFMFFYTLIKVIKYARIKSGKGKMNAKEYFYFCKEMLENKKH